MSREYLEAVVRDHVAQVWRAVHSLVRVRTRGGRAEYQFGLHCGNLRALGIRSTAERSHPNGIDPQVCFVRIAFDSKAKDRLQGTGIGPSRPYEAQLAPLLCCAAGN